MKTEYMREFITLAETLNYSLAAERLYLSQSVLSRHIVSMEEYLDVKLFERTPHSVTLTQAGAFFYDKCKQILSLFESACEETRLRGQGYACRLRIGLPYYSANSYLGSLPQLFSDAYPDIKLLLRTFEPDRCLSDLLRGELDAVMLVRMNYPWYDCFEFLELYKEQLTLLVNENHHLAGKEYVVFSDLKDECFLDISGIYRGAVRDLMERHCHAAGFRPIMSETVYDQFESALIELQHSNKGVLLSGSDVSSLSFKGIKSLTFEEEDSYRWVCLISPKNEKAPAIKLLADCFRRHVGEYGWST